MAVNGFGREKTFIFPFLWFWGGLTYGPSSWCTPCPSKDMKENFILSILSHFLPKIPVRIGLKLASLVVFISFVFLEKIEKNFNFGQKC